MTGLLGVGGGFVIVPLLRRFTNVSIHGVIATSLLVIALVGAEGVIISVMHGTNIHFGLTAYFTAGTACGMLIGRQAASRLCKRYFRSSWSSSHWGCLPKRR